jgi:peptidoglycan/xylan/chitin deacetylase (PgdA/CDA1 family)
MLSYTKRLVFRSLSRLGWDAILLKSNWRARRLLILAYHGVSLDDEHLCSGLYMSPEQFRGRLEYIRRAGCNVLPLSDALAMLYEGSLPARSVVLTFDDGFYDFYAEAWPMLRGFGWPATVYLPTYYSIKNVPVFDPMVMYLLWKGRGKDLSLPEIGIDRMLVEDAPFRQTGQILGAAQGRGLSGEEKHRLLRVMAARLGVSFEDLLSRRILHLMKPEEVAELASEGVDFELHCHRHRVYRSRELFRDEILENQRALERFGAPKPQHFCYPGGFWLPEFTPWLVELGILSATACEAGMATSMSDRYKLPRFLDGPGVEISEFSSWLSGFASLLPTRKYPPSSSQLGDAEYSIAPARS